MNELYLDFCSNTTTNKSKPNSNTNKIKFPYIHRVEWVPPLLTYSESNKYI